MASTSFFDKEIGHGQFANIYKKEENSKVYAIKHTLRSHYAKGLHEALILKELSKFNSDNIVKYIDHLHNRSKRIVVLSMELVKGQTLLDVLMKHNDNKTSIPISEIKEIFRQLTKAVEVCHNANIAHNDLKLENIMWDGKRLVLLDFNLSNYIYDDKDHKTKIKYNNCAGSFRYAAQEFVEEADHYTYGPNDIWSMGVVLYTLVSGFFPFSGKTKFELTCNIRNGDILFCKKFSDDLKDLICNTFNSDPTKRITITQIKNHPFLK